MKRSVQLKQTRTTKIGDWDALIKKVEGEKRDFTQEENDSISAFRTAVEKLDSEIENQEALEKRLADAAVAAGAGIVDGEAKEKASISKRFSINKMFRSALDNVSQDGAESEVQAIAEVENRNAGIGGNNHGGKNRVMIPLSFLRATQQTVSQDSGNYGGQLVQNQAPKVVAGLEPKLWLQELGAEFMPGLTGGDVPMPVANSFGFEWLAEGANITGQKNTFTGPVLNPKRAGASVSISNRLINQSGVNTDELVRKLLSQGWENAINSAAINGAGGVAPMGILNFAGVGVAGDVAAVAADYAKITELQALIEEANSTDSKLAYLMHPKLKAALKMKSKDAGSGRFILEGNEVDGYRFVSTSLVPVGDAAGTPVYPLIYGDFSQLFIGQWGAVSFLVNPYSEDLSDSVRITVNTYADVQIANPLAFAKNAFLTNG